MRRLCPLRELGQECADAPDFSDLHQDVDAVVPCPISPDEPVFINGVKHHWQPSPIKQTGDLTKPDFAEICDATDRDFAASLEVLESLTPAPAAKPAKASPAAPKPALASAEPAE